MNDDPRIIPDGLDDELWTLCSALCDGTIDRQGLDRLESLAQNAPENLLFCTAYMRMNGQLMRTFRPIAPREKRPGGGWLEDKCDDSPAYSAPPFRRFFGGVYHGAVGFFSHELSLSLLITTVLYGFGLLLSSLLYVTHHTDFAGRLPAHAPDSPAVQREKIVYVGRITGIAGAKWSDDPDYIAPMGVYVRLGRQYKLKSGLLEISYDSGAKVILEGPCSYEVDSNAGGYLSLGKLVARVGAGGEGRGTGEVASGQWPVASMKDENGQRNAASLPTTHYPLSTNSSPLSPLPSPLFTVRTPTAVVTDLGTEFGVEVDIHGDTTSHVFQGTVVIQAGFRGVGESGIGNSGIGNSGIGDSGVWNSDKRPATAVAGGEPDQSFTLVAGQSVCIGRVRETNQEPAAGESTGGTGLAGGALRFTNPTVPPQFTRRIVERPKVVDLLDVVAGGSGMGKLRGSGIDTASGRRLEFIADKRCVDDGQYHFVPWNRLIDGVFIPDGWLGAVQVDSAENTFDGFPTTKGRSWGPIWARAADDEPVGSDDDPNNWMQMMGRVERFAPQRRGLLCMHANAGITFDLAEIRRLHRATRPLCFQATAGLIDSSRVETLGDGLADLWIIVDGRLKMKRVGLGRQDAPVIIDVELAAADGFLTLAVTDGGDGITADWFVFGDPVLKMKPEGEKRLDR